MFDRQDADRTHWIGLDYQSRPQITSADNIRIPHITIRRIRTSARPHLTVSIQGTGSKSNDFYQA